MRKFEGNQLVIASHNKGKLREIAALLTPFGITVSSAADHGLDEPDETENTFVGNARIKAHYAAKATGLPALSDDSGITVDALDGAPGVIRGRGETLTGQRVELELTIMPLAKQTERADSNRLLGLYQTLGGEPLLKGRPVWRHRVSMLVPPDTRISEPRMKLVASNA